jgi:hypothetical protein
MSGNDGVRVMWALSHRPFGKIQTQTSLAHLRVGTVTSETTTSQNWLNVLIEVQPVRGRMTTAGQSAQCDGTQQCNERELYAMRLGMCLRDMPVPVITSAYKRPSALRSILYCYF